MKTKNLTYNLEQRISYLGYQKLEEEVLFEKLREKMSQPIPEDKYSSTTLRQCSFEHIITKFLFITTFVITAFNQSWCQTEEEIISQFEQKRWVLDNDFELLYYTFMPTASKPANGYPLIIGLHGTVEMIDNFGPGAHLTRREVIKRWITSAVQDTYAPYVLAPQVYLNRSWGDKDVHIALNAIIQSLIDEGTVDPDRVYVLGHSVGGFGAWAFPVLSKIPVAAVAPMSGFWFSEEEGKPSVEATKGIFSEISIWAFHYTSALELSPPTREIVKILEKAGLPFVTNDQPHSNNKILNNTHLYTEYTPQTFACSGYPECHQVCDIAIPNPIFIEWLFQQRRGRPPATAIQITSIDTVSEVSSVSWAIENEENSVAIYFQPLNSEEWTLLGKAVGSKENYRLTNLPTEPQPRGKLRVDALNANNEVYGSDTSSLVTLRRKVITDVPSEVPQTTVVVYPNPAEDVLYWQGTDRFNEGTYNIVDVLGRIVVKGRVTGDGVSVSQLATGSYLLSLHSPQYLEETVRIRFLKQ